MTDFYADVLEDGRVRACLPCDDETPLHQWHGQAEGTLVLLDSPIDWSEGGETSVLYLIDGKKKWVETADIPALKLRKRSEITQKRLAADADRFTYQGKEIRTAEKDILDLLISDARWNKGKPLNWPGGWLTIDNSYVAISTKAEWDAFFVAMYDAGISNFQRSQQLKARINAASTPEEIAAITWNQPLEKA